MKGDRALVRDLGLVCTTISAETPREMARKAASAFAFGSELVELRFDLLRSPDAAIPAELSKTSRRSVITVRRRDEGGAFSGTEPERLGLLSRLSGLRPRFMDLELQTLLENPGWYATLPRTSQRIVSWHDLSGTPTLSVLEKTRMAAASMGDMAKIVTKATRFEDSLRVLRLYEKGASRLVAFSTGPSGAASRLASMQLGSPIVYAALPGEPVAPGQISVETVVGLKRILEWKGLVEAYRLLGEDVSRSLSPSMMNAAFRATGIDACYEAVSVGKGGVPRKVPQRSGRRRVGVNLTIPFKSDVIPLLDALDEVSARIGAVNVVARTGQRYKGYNTDVNGITAPLRERGMGRVRKALLLGAGGAARAFCEAMSQLGCAEITVAVRDAAKGERFASEMAMIFGGIRFSVVVIDRVGGTEADLVFNATPIGAGDPLPEALKRVIYGHATVFDAVYRPMKTELLRTAEEKGSPIICGYEMLLNQGTMAFELWTGKPAPKAVMESALRTSLEGAR